MKESDTVLRRVSHLAQWHLYAIDLGLTWLALWLADMIRRAIPFGLVIAPGTVYLTPVVFGMVGLIWSLAFLFFGVYSHARRRALDEFRTLISALSVATVILAGTLYFTRTRDFSRLLVAYFFLLDLSFLVGVRWARRLLLAGLGRGRLPRALVIGGGPTAHAVAHSIIEHPGAGFALAGMMDPQSLPSLDALVVSAHAQLADCAILALPIEQFGLIAPLIGRLQELPIQIFVVPDYLGAVALAPRLDYLADVPLIGISDLRIRGLNRILKRVIDVALTSLTLVALAPLFVGVALAIKLDSPGPVLFRQPRVGQDGRLFTILKFRSMVPNADRMLDEIVLQHQLSEAPIKLKNDPRVTRVGRLLRRTSLDELPQLLNVLWGDMSLVGPRPEEPRLVQHYNGWQRKRLGIKPGLTGPMQVNGRGDLSLDERVRLEIAYIQHYSLLEDLKLMVRTVPALISGKGAY